MDISIVTQAEAYPATRLSRHIAQMREAVQLCQQIVILNREYSLATRVVHVVIAVHDIQKAECAGEPAHDNRSRELPGLLPSRTVPATPEAAPKERRFAFHKYQDFP